MHVEEVPFVAAARFVVRAVLDNVVALDGVACAFGLQVEACDRVVLHPVAGDVVVAQIIQVDAVIGVRVGGVARQVVVT